MGERIIEFDEFAQILIDGRFDQLFDGEELDQFYAFLKGKAVHAKGFVISFPVKEGGLMWMRYKIQSLFIRRDKVDLEFEGQDLIYNREDPSDRSIPTECVGYPIWSLKNDNDEH